FQRKAIGACSVAVWANNQGIKGGVPLKVSQGTLAEMVGTTRARVSKFMNTFRKKGCVRYNGGGLQINSTLITGFLQSRPVSVATKAYARPVSSHFRHGGSSSTRHPDLCASGTLDRCFFFVTMFHNLQL